MWQGNSDIESQVILGLSWTRQLHWGVGDEQCLLLLLVVVLLVYPLLQVLKIAMGPSCCSACHPVFWLSWHWRTIIFLLVLLYYSSNGFCGNTVFLIKHENKGLFLPFFLFWLIVRPGVFDKCITYIIRLKMSQIWIMAIKIKATSALHFTCHFSRILPGLFQTVVLWFDVDRQRAPLGAS